MSDSSFMVSRLGGEGIEEIPPAIPQKTKKKTETRQPSPYDNVPDLENLMGN